MISEGKLQRIVAEVSAGAQSAAAAMRASQLSPATYHLAPLDLPPDPACKDCGGRGEIWREEVDQYGELESITIFECQCKYGLALRGMREGKG
jgi:hypothetical protein